MTAIPTEMERTKVNMTAVWVRLVGRGPRNAAKLRSPATVEKSGKVSAAPQLHATVT